MINIKIENYEGPLDLLLHLIENKKIDIREIKISEIIDEYLEIIKKYEEDNFKLKVEFLQMASELLQIKAQSILKKDKELELEHDLQKRLLEYKVLKEIATKLSENENIYYRSYAKKMKNTYENEIVEHDNSFLTIENLKNAIDVLYLKFNKKDLNKITIETKESFTVQEAIEEILNIDHSIKFSELLKGSFSKNRIVSFFMAILELYKENKINLIIEDDIQIIKEKNV